MLEHDNVQPHISIRTLEAITSFGWIMVPHLIYSPDLAPSDNHLFGAMKDALGGKQYANDKEMKIAFKNWLRK